MFNTNKRLLKYLWVPLLFLLGCSATVDKKVDSVDSRMLEKRVDDLSSTITLVVNDGNRLHNEFEELQSSDKTFLQKFEQLEATVRNLNEQIVSLNTSVKTPETVQPPIEETNAEPPVSTTDNSEPADKQEPTVQKPISGESQLAMAMGFWDAMNAKDIQAIKSYVTKESRDKLQIKDNDATANCKVTFGEIKIEDNKTSIETTMQTHNETTEFEVRMQTILVKEDGQWKVDADKTMMSMFGGAVGEMVKGLGKAVGEGIKKGAEEIEKAMAETTQKGHEETTQTNEVKTDIAPPKQETAEISKQTKVEGLQKDTGETTQTSEVKPDIVPPKQETTFASEEAKRESFLKDNITRLAEVAFPDNKGIQWNIISLEHKAHLTYAEVEPSSETAGYSRFKFVISFKNPEAPNVIGTYCFKDGQYSLFSAKKK